MFRKEWKKIIRKTIYPYEHTDSFERSKKVELPPKERFYSLLNDEDITDEEYKHAQKIWRFLNIKNLGEWHDLYLKLDALLLAGVFEKFNYLDLFGIAC